MTFERGRIVLLGSIAFAMLTAPAAFGSRGLDSQKDLDPRFPINNPVSTYWNELYPDPTKSYHLSSWFDNGDGYLSPSDIIDLTDLSDPVGNPTFWHVDQVTITIFLTQKNTNTHGIGDFSGDFFQNQSTMYNPVSTFWEWIPPGTGGFHLSSWEDNGDGYLSRSDQIDITESNGLVTFWHVDRVTTDIIISPEPSSIAAVGVGFASLLALRRRRK
jgi:hypothetical protein